MTKKKVTIWSFQEKKKAVTALEPWYPQLDSLHLVSR